MDIEDMVRQAISDLCRYHFDRIEGAHRAGLVWFVVLAFLMSDLACASNSMTVGIATHFGQAKTDFRRLNQWLTKSQIYSTRDEMYWDHLEKQPGVLQWQGNARITREAWSELKRQWVSFNPLLVVDYGNSVYGWGQPSTDLVVGAFSRYVNWVARENEPIIRLYEIWNEWNIGGGTRPKVQDGSPEAYVRLVRASYRSIKDVDPTFTVLVGALGSDLPDWPWLRRAISLGLLEYADGVSVHLYNHCDKRNVGADELASRLDQLKQILVLNGKPNLPIYVTEVGWPTDEGKCGLSELQSAVHTFRFLLEASARPWIGGVWFYEFMDGGDNPSEREDRFGLLRRDGTEKPSGCIVRELSRVVSQRPKQFVRRGGVSLAVYSNSEHDLLVGWTASKEPAADVSVQLRSGRLLGVASTICGVASGEVAGFPDSKRVTFRLRGLAPLVVPVSKGFQIN